MPCPGAPTTSPLPSPPSLPRPRSPSLHPSLHRRCGAGVAKRSPPPRPRCNPSRGCSPLCTHHTVSGGAWRGIEPRPAGGQAIRQVRGGPLYHATWSTLLPESPPRPAYICCPHPKHSSTVLVPTRPWLSVSLDLITDLVPSHYHDAVLVMVDRLTKQTLFIPTTKSMATRDVASLFVQHVVWFTACRKSW